MTPMTTALQEQHEHLWTPVVAPVIWAAHFLCCYMTAAMWCGRFASAQGSERLVTLIAVYTVIAVALIALCFAHGFKSHAHQLPDTSNDDDSPIDRHRFIAFTTMLLAGLSLVATLFVGAAAMMMDRCA
jgi:hypothetical protein